MPEYRVTWCIDIDADNPHDAAKQAEAYMDQPGARCYFVEEWNADGTFKAGIDLDLDAE